MAPKQFLNSRTVTIATLILATTLFVAQAPAQSPAAAPIVKKHLYPDRPPIPKPTSPPPSTGPRRKQARHPRLRRRLVRRLPGPRHLLPPEPPTPNSSPRTSSSSTSTSATWTTTSTSPKSTGPHQEGRTCARRPRCARQTPLLPGEQGVREHAQHGAPNPSPRSSTSGRPSRHFRLHASLYPYGHAREKISPHPRHPPSRGPSRGRPRLSQPRPVHRLLRHGLALSRAHRRCRRSSAFSLTPLPSALSSPPSSTASFPPTSALSFRATSSPRPLILGPPTLLILAVRRQRHRSLQRHRHLHGRRPPRQRPPRRLLDLLATPPPRLRSRPALARPPRHRQPAGRLRPLHTVWLAMHVMPSVRTPSTSSR